MNTAMTRELNAVIAIAARDVVRGLRSVESLVFSLIFPVIFIGMMGETIAQNLGNGLGFNYMQFILIGGVINALYQTTVGNISNLVEERQTDFTQEMFVAPISRYAIILGKILGSSVGSMFQLVGVLAIALILRIPLGGMDFVRLLLLTPAVCLSAGAMGAFVVAFVHEQRTAQAATMIVMMPQLFLSGALIPMSHSTGLLAFLARLMPMTYIVDLARAVFYWGQPAYGRIVMYPPALDAGITATLFVIFSVVGTILFARAEQNR